MALNKSERLKLLLERGYFPEELPPPFNTHDIARFRQIIWSRWAAIPGEYPRTTAESYSIPKADRMRRQLAIVNPIAQVNLAKLIADEWITIARSLSDGSYSVTVPQIVSNGIRAVPLPDFSLLAQRKAEVSATYDTVLGVDISRFYGTLYTHAIPWAMHTKAWSKANLDTPVYRASLGARIDKAIRKGQDNQTLGIPVGPDTSRIAAELVGAAIDRQLRATKSFKQDQAYRFVDDSFVGFDTPGEASDAISAFAAACRVYELELSDEKTGTLRSEAQVDASWATDLKQHPLGGSLSGQARRVEHYIAKAFDFAQRYPTDGVLDYAVKRTRSANIAPANWHRYETFLLHAARAKSRVIPAVAQILTNYKFRGYALGDARVEKLIHDVIIRDAPLGHYAEVAWALFLAKALRLTLPADVCAIVSTLESSVCALLALDLEARGLLSVPLDKSTWYQVMSSSGLRSSNWLLAYEADIKGWLIAPGQNHVDGDPYFSELKTRGISFYDVTANVPKIARRRVVPGPLPPIAPAGPAPDEANGPQPVDAADVPDAVDEDNYGFLHLAGLAGYFW